jgi:Heparinase II/III-like protein/Heparinase II/III N-terminus
MNKLTRLAQIGRAFGMRDSVLRLNYELQRGSGLISRRMRSAEGWERWTLEQIAPGASAEEFLRSRRQGDRPFFFADARALAGPLRNILGTDEEKSVLAEAENILNGNLPFFGRLSFACGFPPNWFQNPATGQRVSPSRPWTTMRFASPDYGDLKFILEPSRFLFVYPLARAYILSGDERFAEAFWTALEDWARKNPPMSGPLWVCGQESSLRSLAWSFALHAFLHSSTTTPERAAPLVSMIAAHAWRTELTIGYARSQRSNHLFSEAVGLWTAGTLYPELKQAAAWQQLGARLLEEAVLDQITPHGVHLQYSFNYQRMILHLLLWTLRLAEIHHIELPSIVRERAAVAFEFMRAFVDLQSGRAPNYGSNDGSHILPLTQCDYGDFRPLLQMGSCVLNHRPAVVPGIWDEAALWMCGKPAEGEPGEAARTPAATGYHRLGGQNSWALVRAGHYRRRPFQADQLHVDLWWKGFNLARDAGTYLYNGEPPWDNGLARTLVHNTVTVDGHDQMRRAGRFLWLDWAQASGRSFSTQNGPVSDRFEGEHDGYRRLGVEHRRSVHWLGESGWVVIDDLLGQGEHGLHLHWLVADSPFAVVAESPFQVALSTPHGRVRWHFFSCAAGQSALLREGKSLTREIPNPDSAMLGWESPTYGQLSPALSLVHRVHAPLPVRLLTVIQLEEKLHLESSAGQVTLHLGSEEIQRIALNPWP